MLMGMIDVAIEYPELIKKCFGKKEDNNVEIKLLLDGQKRVFDINTYLPIGQNDTYSKELLWMYLLEKAFAKVFGAWNILGSIGSPGEMHPILTGAPSI